MFKKGDTAPDFTLLDQNGIKHTLSTNKGNWVLLYFYPKDFTPGCTKEACDIRDNIEKFAKFKVKVFGISADSVESHKKFSQKYSLPFTLLSDESKEVLQKYGVWKIKKFLGKEFMGIARTSFLISPEGKIFKIYENVNPIVHAENVLSDLQLNF